MKLSAVLLLASAPLVPAWRMTWGPMNSNGDPKYLRVGTKDLSLCQDFRHQFAGVGSSADPGASKISWDPSYAGSKGCCLVLYGGTHTCRRLEGGWRYTMCQRERKAFPASAQIQSYRVLDCK